MKENFFPARWRYRHSLLAHAALFILLMWPYFFAGQIIAPHRQDKEMGVAQPRETTLVENRKFNDYFTCYIPEIDQHLHGKASGWLATWSPYNELGRPLYHISGFSPAYAPAWLLGRLTGDPFRYLTVLSLTWCFLAGVFMLLACRELKLSPWAALGAAWLCASAPSMLYWLTFPMFLAAWCWSAGALFGLVRLVNRRDLVGWAALALSIHSLLMTAYPQMVVFHAYLLTGWGVWRAWGLWREQGTRVVLRTALAIGSAIAIGVIVSLPTYLDLAHTTADSLRAAPDLPFFAAHVPSLQSASSAARFVLLCTFPEVVGNPASGDYPLPDISAARSITPIFLLLAVLSALTAWRRTWGLWVAVLLTLALALIPSLYFFAVRHLGFGFSRCTPLTVILLPMVLIAAYGIEVLVARGWRSVSGQMHASAGIVLLIYLGTTGFCIAGGLPIRWSMFALSMMVALLFAWQGRWTRPIPLVVAAVLVGGGFSFPLLLRQHPGDIVQRSRLSDTVRLNLPEGSRFAVVDKSVTALQPNLNASVQLASIHSYDSLSPRRYHQLIAELGGVVRVYGRRNNFIGREFDTPAFFLSNIALVLSREKIQDSHLSLVGSVEGIGLYRPRSIMGSCLQIPATGEIGPAGIQIADPRAVMGSTVRQTRNEGDLLEYQVTPGPASVLLISQLYHSDWHAYARTPRGTVIAATEPVNGVFQGVSLPAGTSAVQMRFEPWARLSWIGHIFCGVLVLLLAGNAVRAARRRHGGEDRICCQSGRPMDARGITTTENLDG